MFRMISLHKCILTISLSILIESSTVLCATVDPATFYQRSNDGSYRYGYNAGGGFSARQSASAANEVNGQYAQLQPDGRIENVRYKAGVGGFRPQYAAASSTFNGAALGASGYPARQSLGNGFYGAGSGPFGARSLGGGSPFGYNNPGIYNGGSFGGAGFSGNGAPGGGSFGARSFGDDAFGGASVGSGSLGGSPGGRSLGTGSAGAGSIGGGFHDSGALGSRRAGGSQGRTPSGTVGSGLHGNGDIGSTSVGPNSGHGYPGAPNVGGGLEPGSFANRPPIGGSLGTGALGGTSADGTFAPGVRSSAGNNIGPLGPNTNGGTPQQRFGSGSAGSVYGGFPRYAASSAFGSPFGYPQRVPLAFVYTTPRPFTTPATNYNAGATGDGSNRFSNSNDDPSRTTHGDSRGVGSGTNTFPNVAGNHNPNYANRPNTGFRSPGGSLAAPNGIPNQITSAPTTRIPTAGHHSDPRNDGTYNFAYRTPDSTRQESADGNGNVQGSYSFRNENGDHDLSFIAGPSTGFQPTGGSLAVPNGIGQGRTSTDSSSVSPTAATLAATVDRPDNSNQRSLQVNPTAARTDQTGDGYGARSGQDFETTESGGPEQSLATTVRSLPTVSQNNNGFQNGASNGQGFNGERSGTDQRFQSGANNGFQQVGGNSASGRRTGENLGSDGSNGFQQINPSYGLNGARGAGGNLGSSSNSGFNNRGNGLGNAGSESGFGSDGRGSLSNGYGYSGGLTSSSDRNPSYGTGSSNSNQGRDGSYDFSYDTGRQAHRESGDGSGRVDGRYSYLSDGRQQSLSYRVRPGTGFEVTGGNLASKTVIPK